MRITGGCCACGDGPRRGRVDASERATSARQTAPGAPHSHAAPRACGPSAWTGPSATGPWWQRGGAGRTPYGVPRAAPLPPSTDESGRATAPGQERGSSRGQSTDRAGGHPDGDLQPMPVAAPAVARLVLAHPTNDDLRGLRRPALFLAPLRPRSARCPLRGHRHTHGGPTAEVPPTPHGRRSRSQSHTRCGSESSGHTWCQRSIRR